MAGPTARERAETILSIIPWLAARDGAPLSELSERFGVPETQLRDDLVAVGLDVNPSVDPYEMVEVDIEEGTDFVSVRLMGYFDRPPALSVEEALILLASGTAMLDDPMFADLPLASAIERLVAGLGAASADAVSVELGPADKEVLATVRTATDEGRCLRIEYFSWGRDALDERVVEPHALRNLKGHWYLTGWCRSAQGVRSFRVDRIVSASPQGPAGAVEQPEDPAPVLALQDAEGGRSIRIRVPVERSWVIARHPVRSWRVDDDQVEVTLDIHADAWLDRLLLQLGPHASVHDLDSGESLAPRRAEVARRILSRYGSGVPST